MSLKEYRKKRSFEKSPEPRARAVRRRAKDLSFVVQKHAARRLHYDLRLEMDGVLKSWAVPRGPSLDPADKRLAVEVEDHPLEYGGFEGTIPEGEYGAGTVLIWDRGRWIPEGDPAASHKKGQLKFWLEGEKLRGKWALIRMTGERGGARGENWLLIKEKDEVAKPGHGGEILEERPESVVSGRGAAVPPLPRLPGARKASLSRTFKLQLATLIETPPRGDEWIHEIKLDGYRILARLEGGKATLITRSGKDWTTAYPSVARAVESLPAGAALLDGEVVVLDEKGVSDFGALQNALGSTDPRLIYYMFDILHLDGWDLTGVRLADRKRVLEDLAGKKNGTARYLDHIEGHGEEFFGQACRHGLEGVVSKRRDRPHRPGRTTDWLKIKCGFSQELVIGGWTDPAGSRTGLGALLLGLHGAGGRLEYVGKVGTGFSEKTLEDLRRRLGEIETSTPPFAVPLSRAEAWRVHWVKPVLVAQVRFAAWTKDRKLRHTTFQGLREDKPPREVVRETPAKAAKPAAKQSGRSSGKGGVVIGGIPLTNPERIYYPERGITKETLVRFYEAIAPRLLPHLDDRPVTAVRCPRGIDKPCFFQKHANESVPEAVRRMQVPEGKGKALYLAVDSVEALLTLIQLGTLELHIWGSRAGTLEQPDRIVFDLDPGPGVPWPAVVEAAFLVRDRLRHIGLSSLVKTTGGKGLHVAAPIEPESSWDEVKEVSRVIAESIAADDPDRYVATSSKAQRQGKIYIDYLRNGRGATSVAPYSTRARPGAPVSTPLRWEELRSVQASNAFTIENLLPRLARQKRDPWEEALAPKQSFTRALRKFLGSRPL